jgi:hypothetical protein
MIILRMPVRGIILDLGGTLIGTTTIFIYREPQ